MEWNSFPTVSTDCYDPTPKCAKIRSCKKSNLAANCIPTFFPQISSEAIVFETYSFKIHLNPLTFYPEICRSTTPWGQSLKWMRLTCHQTHFSLLAMLFPIGFDEFDFANSGEKKKKHWNTEKKQVAGRSSFSKRKKSPLMLCRPVGKRWLETARILLLMLMLIAVSVLNFVGMFCFCSWFFSHRFILWTVKLFLCSDKITVWGHELL